MDKDYWTEELDAARIFLTVQAYFDMKPNLFLFLILDRLDSIAGSLMSLEQRLCPDGDDGIDSEETKND